MPVEEIDSGSATANRLPDLKSSDWLVINSSNSPPANSELSIEYRGHWYYIGDSDLKSRETFAMITALFAVVGGTVPGPTPF